MSYVIIAGKYEDIDGELDENIKYISEQFENIEDAEKELEAYSHYHFAYIEEVYWKEEYSA